jgi:hypothetical protein
MMKVFFSIDRAGTCPDMALVSIGCISENGKSFYAEVDSFGGYVSDEYVRENISLRLKFFHTDNRTLNFDEFRINNLDTEVFGSYEFIEKRISLWLYTLSHDKAAIEMWSDRPAYSWVLFCSLWKDSQIPQVIYPDPFDLLTLFKSRNINPDFDREKYAKVENISNNALYDAYVVKACYERLMEG